MGAEDRDFTLIDFRGATNHFAGPAFDGPPIVVYEPGENDPIAPPEDVPPPGGEEDPIPAEPGGEEVIIDGEPPDINLPPGGVQRRKVYVDGVGVTILAGRVALSKSDRRLGSDSRKNS